MIPDSGLFAYRKDGIAHAWNPETISTLQIATRMGSYKKFKEFTNYVDNKEKQIFIRDFFEFKKAAKPISIDEVEPVESIVKHFVTGAMSFGAISIEAHEAIALAMNKLGTRSNTGEGGEDNARYHSSVDGVSLSSKTKQIASGRFGVTAEYLVNAEEIQIKVAQGANREKVVSCLDSKSMRLSLRHVTQYQASHLFRLLLITISIQSRTLLS